MSLPPVYIAHTNREWFDNLSITGAPRADGLARVDEVNFWSPKSPKPIKRFARGEPVFFRLGAPERRIAGYGFFADHLSDIDVLLAWRLFGPKNGAPTLIDFARILGRTNATLRHPLGCTLLRDATFWPEARWIPWGSERGYASTGLQRGRTEADVANLALLHAQLQLDAVAPPQDLAPRFHLVEGDARRVVTTEQVRREGQGTFRARLLKAYRVQCAITGEHTEPVLDAAHIQPYLGPASNHLQNGLLLAQEFHTLFDRGLVCVEPRGDDYTLRVSKLLEERWNNGRRYREYDGKALRVPDEQALRPSIEALEWHREEVYEKVA